MARFAAREQGEVRRLLLALRRRPRARGFEIFRAQKPRPEFALRHLRGNVVQKRSAHGGALAEDSVHLLVAERRGDDVGAAVPRALDVRVERVRDPGALIRPAGINRVAQKFAPSLEKLLLGDDALVANETSVQGAEPRVAREEGAASGELGGGRGRGRTSSRRRTNPGRRRRRGLLRRLAEARDARLDAVAERVAVGLGAERQDERGGFAPGLGAGDDEAQARGLRAGLVPLVAGDAPERDRALAGDPGRGGAPHEPVAVDRRRARGGSAGHGRGARDRGVGRGGGHRARKRPNPARAPEPGEETSARGRGAGRGIIEVAVQVRVAHLPTRRREYCRRRPGSSDPTSAPRRT